MLDASVLASMSALLGMDLSTAPEIEKVETVETPQVKPTEAKKTSKSIEKSDTEKPIVHISRPIKTFDLDTQFRTIGFNCINTGRPVTGYEAKEILNYIWDNYPAVANHFESKGYLYALRIKFANLSEESEIVRNSKPKVVATKDKNGKYRGKVEVNQSVSKRTQKTLSLDYRRPILIQTTLETLYTEVIDYSQRIKVLPSQAKSENKSKSGFATMKGVKLKANTGTKSVTAIQKTLGAVRKSKAFSLPGYNHPFQVQVTDSGLIYLNEFNPSSGYKTLCRVAKVSSFNVIELSDNEVQLTFNWSYFNDRIPEKGKPKEEFSFWERFTELTAVISQMLNGKSRDRLFIAELKKQLANEGKTDILERARNSTPIPKKKYRKHTTQKPKDKRK